MAPILATATGVPSTPLDDPQLANLLIELSQDTEDPSLKIIAEILEPYHEKWFFEEQVDLHEWITALNMIDLVIVTCVENNPQLLLIAPLERKGAQVLGWKPSNEDISVDILQQLRIVLKFTANLLQNCTSKSLFNSVEEVACLLSCADDAVSDAALELLQALALPPALHKLQQPEVNQHTSMLHNSKSESHNRLTSLARGYGTRAMGLGLGQLVMADDSIHEQLPAEAGHVLFEFYMAESTDDVETEMARIHLLESDIVVQKSNESKRRKVTGSNQKEARSTAELFALAVEKVGGIHKIPLEKRFDLLAEIRMARCFYTQRDRITAVERRLRALTTILYAHPSQEVMQGYFQAQPELSIELADLLRGQVSQSTVSSVTTGSTGASYHKDGIASLSSSELVPFRVKMLAVEALTGLVARREGSAGTSGSIRLSNVLVELGVVKGQYIGLLPTLIRFSLSSLGSVDLEAPVEVVEDDDTMQVGLAFLEATAAPQAPRIEQVERALELIDNILTLTSSVVSSPSGTSAMTDCGIVPVLLNTISMDTQDLIERILPSYENESIDSLNRIRAFLRFIAAQAVQILEGAIVTHNNALAAFRDLKGVQMLTGRLSKEVSRAQEGEDRMLDSSDGDSVRSSQRVLLFSLVTCLTVVFHQESTSSNTEPSGGAELKKPELTAGLIAILGHVSAYGGHIASLVSTLLSDVMNSDPQVVHYVHESGVGKAFLDMVTATESSSTNGGRPEPIIPPVPDLVMAIPNVISALSLTEDGANRVLELNPFPSILRIFLSRKYAMPASRCLLNEMTAIVGTGLDEIMRHVEKLKPIVLSSLAQAMKDLVTIAQDLERRERHATPGDDDWASLEVERSCLIQYVLNFGQMLEQILHNEDHCLPFVEAGGLEALLALFPASMPSGLSFLTHVSGMSSPSVSTLHHSTIEDGLAVALKCVQFRYDPSKLLNLVTAAVEQHATHLEEVRTQFAHDDLPFGLNHISTRPLHELLDEMSDVDLRGASEFLRAVAIAQWGTSLLATTLKAANHKSRESGSGWNLIEREWKRRLSRPDFSNLVSKLASFQREGILTVCRNRSSPDFMNEEKRRLKTRSSNVCYRLRIVCPEGAVVRDGIDIDSCSSVGSMEMGEIADAFDRCINSSGIMRYRTSRGWISEMTRGHGREPIAEVVRLSKLTMTKDSQSNINDDSKRIEAPVPGLRDAVMGVLARAQFCYSDLFAALSRVAVQGLRTLTTSSLTFEEDSQAHHVCVLSRMLFSNVDEGLSIGFRSLVNQTPTSRSAAAMYFGFILSHVQACLFDERRERRVVNFPLLVFLISKSASSEAPSDTLFAAMRHILENGFEAFSSDASKPVLHPSVAASFSPLFSLLHEILSTPISSSPVASVMSRMKPKDMELLVGLPPKDIAFLYHGSKQSKTDALDSYYRPEAFRLGLILLASNWVRAAFSDERLARVPAHLVHPFVNLAGDVIVAIEEAKKKKATASSSRSSSGGTLLSDLMRVRESLDTSHNEPFEASEEILDQLTDMGFSRDHALDAIESTRSNRLEEAMEYALQHPPPSLAAIERRRIEREERQRRMEGGTSAQNPEPDGDEAPANGPSVAGNTEPASIDNSMDADKAQVEEDDAPEERLLLSELSWWLDHASELVASSLSAVSVGSEGAACDGNGNGEVEAFTVILTSFALDICHKYPEKRISVTNGIFDKLVEVSAQATENAIERNCWLALSSLSHSSVLITRAIPSTRLQLLAKGALGPLTTLVGEQVLPILRGGDLQRKLPMWLPHVLLLFDNMAQPVTSFSKNEDLVQETLVAKSADFEVVMAEHEARASRVSDLATSIFGALSGQNVEASGVKGAMSGGFSGSMPEPSSCGATGAVEPEGKSSQSKAVEKMTNKIPAFAPLLTSSQMSFCLSVCRSLLQAAVEDERGLGEVTPGTLQAGMMLLLRLLRSPATSSICVKDGVTEMILALPGRCRFTGNSGLVTLILRRLLEDEVNLQHAMETELKATLPKLAGKSSSPPSERKNVSVPLGSFVEAVMPLICREPTCFLKALALSCRITSGSSPTVHLLSPEEREKHSEKLLVLLDDSARSSLSREAADPSELARRTSSSGSGAKKRSRRKSSSKKNRRESVEQLSPSSRVTSLLLRTIIHAYDFESKSSEASDESCYFLWTSELLVILADLVLAVPACASSVHHYRLHRSKDKSLEGVLHAFSHALSGCPSPPRTFVTFLLHSVLPQDKWSLKNDHTIWDRNKSGSSEESGMLKRKKLRAFHTLRTAQNAARVLVSLIVRPGEGRRRVISDLAFALSGGYLGHGSGETKDTSDSVPLSSSVTKELNAIQAWGELCMGMNSPKVSVSNAEDVMTLSFENIRIMLEVGMLHALMYSLHRVKVLHPFAFNTYKFLLFPLEVLTRPAVNDTVRSMIARESASKGGTGEAEAAPLTCESAIEELPEAEAVLAIAVADTNAGPLDEDIDVEDEEIASEMEEEEDDVEGDSSNSDIDDANEGDEMSEDDVTSDEDESSEESSIEVEEDGEWDVEFDGAMAEAAEEHEPGFDEEVENDRIEPRGDDGWTRIESSGFGGMLVGGLRRHGAVLGGGGGNRGRSLSDGFMDAAETMIGTLIRTGELTEQALADIEGSLGIRLSGNGSRLDPRVDGNMSALRLGASDLNRDGLTRPNSRQEVFGTFPHIHQRSQPDIGYSAFGNGGNAIDISSMEYVFGGPTVHAGNQNYDFVAGRRQDEYEPEIALSQIELQLFPLGPAAVVIQQTQFSLHPLLCGIELPPVNALVSDLRGHGLRATRRGLMETRRPGDWTGSTFTPGGFLVSTANGAIIRSNRAQNSTALATSTPMRSGGGPIGWTDDGLPFDASIENLSRAFETALRGSFQQASTTMEGQNDGSRDSQSSRDEAAANQNAHRSDSIVPNENEQVISDPSQSLNGADRSNYLHNNTNTPSSAGDDDAQGEQEANQNSGLAADGDQVASSLVEGLRLSPGSDGDSNSALASSQQDHVREGDGIAGVDGDEEPQGGAESMDVDETAPTPNDTTASMESVDFSCPPGVDPEVFASLPPEMQRDLVDQQSATREIVEQIEGSSLDPEVLAALPEDMRREVIEQERREREQQRVRDETTADPSNAEEMDNANFLASLAPDLRADILMTADDDFLNTLPASIIAEAQVLRERANTSVQQRAQGEPTSNGENNMGRRQNQRNSTDTAPKKKRYGKVRAEKDQDEIVYLPPSLNSPLSATDLKDLIRLLYLLSPIRPSRLLQKVLQNMAAQPEVRAVISATLLNLLHEDNGGALRAIESLGVGYQDASSDWRKRMDDWFGDRHTFPPSVLIGVAPDMPGIESLSANLSGSLIRRKQGQGAAASMAANLPKSVDGRLSDSSIPPVVATRILDLLSQTCKGSNQFTLHMLVQPDESTESLLEKFIDLLKKPLFFKSAANLEQLLGLLESIVAPLSQLPKAGEDPTELSDKDIEAASAHRKVFVDVPRVHVSQARLQQLCSILAMETCRDTSFTKVHTIIRRLSRVDANRGHVLAELGSVAHTLGTDALRDLRDLRERLDQTMVVKRRKDSMDLDSGIDKETGKMSLSGSVALSTSTGELKLLRVLQTLQALCYDGTDDFVSRKQDGSIFVTEELVHLLRQLSLDELWDELTSCLNIIQVLEGVARVDEEDDKDNGDENSSDEEKEKKKLTNSVAGLLTRFLPSVEAFFVSNASAIRPQDPTNDSENEKEVALENLVGGDRFMRFVSTNKVILNALVRNNASLLDKGLRALVQIAQCKPFLDFDVKRHWFKTQMRRLRQHASRRHGSLRLVIRRKNVFEEAYHSLRLRNAEEMRGRLHITFRDEEGVDAGGLSREFFAILAKEMFNPNYALFTSTEDGSTFQPNPNSSINPDHLSYFRFVGRIVGKALSDGYLLDAHFTRSLYKHMLGIKPTHHDMEAIDPDYYRNLKTILEYNLDDIGLDLTFSIEDHSFGRSQVIDLIPGGRKIAVTEESKAKYVQLVCQHRMTTAIRSQIKAYLDGFYELVSPDLIRIFTPRELELLISGMPDIDIFDLKNNTDYVGWRPADKEIVWFWNILTTLSRNEKASFLQFVTGSSKVPLAGFSELQGMRGVQKFAIHKVSGKKGALMSAHTCFNSLDLPNYDSEDEMKAKLLLAINEGGGAFMFA